MLEIVLIPMQFEDKAFRVLTDTYVTDADGTGIVHQAPAFGEDDHRISLAHGVVRPDESPPCPIDDKGHFTKEVPDFEGIHVKAADPAIQKVLKAKGRLIVQSTLNHSYPYCWRFVYSNTYLSFLI
jgi:isoleucyl-tRNA synthetase